MSEPPRGAGRLSSPKLLLTKTPAEFKSQFHADLAKCRSLLKKIVDATKNDFGHHSWGNGAVYMEAWGVGALEAGDAAAAEEAFQEALAHDAGSVRGALGLWALCGRLGRTEEADRYLKVAERVWAKADPKDFARLQSDMAKCASKIAKPVAMGGE